ncbi:MAG: GHKL domain-containing protein [Lachnospiraceae bacterium]
MIWNIFIRISYMIELLAASMIFMIPLKKRNHYWRKGICFGSILVILSYWYSEMNPGLEKAPIVLIYWGIYILLASLFVWKVVVCSISQAFFCGICACGVQHVGYNMFTIFQLFIGGSLPLPGYGQWEFLLFFIVSYIFFYYMIAKKMMNNGKIIVNKDSVIPTATMLLIVWVINILEMSELEGFQAGANARIIFRIIDSLLCVYVLWVQANITEKMRLEKAIEGIHAISRQQAKYYKITSETIDSINRKSHDLKHQIRALQSITDDKIKQEYITELEKDLMIYDTALETGNRALDVVLMEKGLFCKDHKIQWSCMIDGKKLDFIKVEEIYSLFGNALDNAIEAVLKINDVEKRVISVKVIEHNKIVMIQIQNYCEEILEFEDGIPITTKENKEEHGYGMRSIRYTVEKYDGVITTQLKNQIFILQMMIPMRL